jgi:hypothetical protein
MANDKAAAEFDAFLASCAGESETTVVTAPKPEDEKTIGETVKFVPTHPAEVVEQPKPERTYREVDGKVTVNSCGLPAETTIYPRGYAQLKFSRSWQKFGMYLADLEALKAWFTDPAGYDTWLADAKANGLK